MKKYLVIFFTLLTSVLFFSFSDAQMGGRQQGGFGGGQQGGFGGGQQGGFQGRGQQGGFQQRQPMFTPPKNNMIALGPNSKYLYVVSDNKLYKYSTPALKLVKSASIGDSDTQKSGSSQGGRQQGGGQGGFQRKGPPDKGAIAISKDGKKVYITLGEALYLFNTKDLSILKEASLGKN